jgi:(5-formylfuran-3-yl)methyl phosphate synthase
MTLFLASVNGAEEARIALAQGADIIDLKDAGHGALGALAPEAVRDAVAAVGGRRPVSAVAGDPEMQPGAVLAAATGMAALGASFVKVGLFATPSRIDCIRALAAVSSKVRLIGVMFADAGADIALLPLLAECGFAGVMLDTADKGAGGLLAVTDFAALAAFLDACRTHGLTAGLAGGLEAPDVPRLLLLSPDVLGFRGALCAGGRRGGRLDAAEVAVIRGLIPLDSRSAGAQGGPVTKVDYRLLAARGYALDQAGDAATDRIFVRDFVLPARVGAYAREHERPQNVRFNVDVEVLRPGHAAADMRDVFSYDVVTDSIRMIVAQEHIALLESLAERIAAVVLGHHRVVRVTVRVEKLDLGPGAVGVEITRQRPAEVAKVHHLFPALGEAKAAD